MKQKIELSILSLCFYNETNLLIKNKWPMEIRTQAVNFDADAKLIEFIDKKLGKLDTFYDNIVSTDVFLKLEKTGQVQDKVAEIKIKVPGSTLVAKETCKSFEESIDLGASSLRRQLIKYKDKKNI